MFNRSPELVPGDAYADVLSWQGVFRDPEETQFYGVPSFGFSALVAKSLLRLFVATFITPMVQTCLSSTLSVI